MTKYGHRVGDALEETEEQPDPNEELPARIETHEVRVHHKTDSDRPNGYLYTFHITHGDEEWRPIAFPLVKSKWKGNYWRECAKLDDRDWGDIPYCVKKQLVDVVSGVNRVEDLSPEVDP